MFNQDEFGLVEVLSAVCSWLDKAELAKDVRLTGVSFWVQEDPYGVIHLTLHLVTESHGKERIDTICVVVTQEQQLSYDPSSLILSQFYEKLNEWLTKPKVILHKTPQESHLTCPTCKEQMYYEIRESSCGGYEDEKHWCEKCSKVIWIDSSDA